MSVKGNKTGLREVLMNKALSQARYEIQTQILWVYKFLESYKHKHSQLTCSLVLTTHNGFVVIDVAAPAPAAAITCAPIGS